MAEQLLMTWCWVVQSTAAVDSRQVSLGLLVPSEQICVCDLTGGIALVGCLLNVPARVSQGRICQDNRTCCHTLVEAAGIICRPTQSQYSHTRARYHGGRRPSSDDNFHSPTVIPPSALDKSSIMKRCHHRQTCSHTSPRRSPTMVTRGSDGAHVGRMEHTWVGWSTRGVIGARGADGVRGMDGAHVGRMEHTWDGWSTWGGWSTRWADGAHVGWI